MMVIDNQYEIGQVVYLKTDKDQLPRIVYAIEVLAGGVLVYRLVSGTMVSAHYPYELSETRDYAQIYS